MCATYVCVCLTSLRGVAPNSMGLADVGPKVLVSSVPLLWRPKALPTRGEGWPSVLRAYKTPIFAKGQTLTQSPAHEEKHAGQETPLHYSH